MEIDVPFASYKLLRFFSFFGGLFGVIQSLLWLAMTILAVLAYYCNIDFAGTTANFGTILQLTLFQMYFRGQCTPNQFPTVEFEPLASLDLMKPSTVHIWMFVILGFSTLWLFSSITLLINVKKSNLKYANIFLYIWILLTFVISMIDLVLFVFFVLDFGTLVSHSSTVSLNYANSANAVLLSAQVASSIMFSVAIRGYVFWIMNMATALFLFTQTFKIYDYNKLSETGISGYLNNAYKSDENMTQVSISNQPIKGYDIQSTHPWYSYLTTDIPRARAPKLVRSASVTGLEESFQKRMTNTPEPKPDVVLRKNNPHINTVPHRHTNANNLGYVQTPPPNFEAKPQLRSGILRNSRYQ